MSWLSRLERCRRCGLTRTGVHPDTCEGAVLVVLRTPTTGDPHVWPNPEPTDQGVNG